MELLKEVLVKIIEKEEIHVVFPNLTLSAASVVEMECYKALKRIKTIIENDSLNDFECVERIVCVFEELGSSGGNRHDFG